MQVDLYKIIADIKQMATQIGALKRSLRATWHKPMADEQRELCRLKRRVTERYRLPLTADDSAFLSALARVRPDIDIKALSQHLRALQSRVGNERQMRALLEAHHEWARRLTG